MAIYFAFALTAIHEGSLRAANVLLVLYAVELGASPFVVGLLAAMFSICPALIAVQAGKLADRFGARWLLLTGAAAGTLGMLVPYLFAGVAALFAGAVGMGVLDALFVVCVQNIVGLQSTPENRARNYSNYSLIGSTAGLSGPLIAGFSIDYLGHAAGCAIVALITLIPIVLILSRNDELRVGTPPAAHAQGGMWEMLSDPGVRRTLITSSFLAAGSNLYLFYMPVYAHDAGLSASSIGFVISANAAAIFVVRAILPNLLARYGEDRVLTLAFYVEAVSLMLIPFFKDAYVLALLSFIFGLGMGGGGPIITMLMFARSAQGRSGEGLGLKITVNHLTKMVSPLVFGAMGSALGLLPMFVFNALLMVGGGYLSRPNKPRSRSVDDAKSTK